MGGRPKGFSPPSKLLRDYRHVYEKPADRDQTPGQRALRQLFESDPKSFVAQLARLEEGQKRANGVKRLAAAAAGGGQSSEATGAPVAEGEGERRVREAIERILSQCEKEAG